MKGGATFVTRGFDRKITKRVQALAGIKIKVGIQRGATDDKGGLIAPYAAMNQFGTTNAMGWELIPARPFMTFSADRIADWMDSQEFNRIIALVVSGKKPVNFAVTAISQKAVLITKNTIRDSELYKPNSDRTLADKRKRGRGEKPLLDSTSMLNAVRAVKA